MPPILFSLTSIYQEVTNKKTYLALSTFTAENKSISLSIKDISRLNVSISIKQLLSSLFEDELEFRTYEGKRRQIEQEKPISIFRLRPGTAQERLKIASQNNALLLNTTKVIFDPFTKVTLTCHATETENHVLLETTAHMGTRSYTIDKTVQLLIHPPHLLYIQGFLRSFHDDISKDLLLLIRQKHLSHKEYRSLKTIAQELPEEIFKLILLKSHSENNVLPIPQLHFLDSQFRYAVLHFTYNSHKVSYPLDLLSPMTCTRNKAYEEQAAKDLLDVGFEWKVSEQQFFLSQEKRNEALQFLLELGWHITDPANKLLRPCHATHIQPSLQGNFFCIDGTLSFESTTVAIQDAYCAIKTNKLTLSLNPSEVGFLGTPTLASLSSLLGEITILNGKAQLPKNRLGLVQDMLNLPAIAPERSLFDQKPSCCFKGKLRPYQEDGVTWMKGLYEQKWSGILADEMGLGKTVQLLAFIARSQALLPTLIVAPAALLKNWEREINQFCKELTVHIVQGTNTIPKTTFNIIITSYTTLRMAPSFFQTISWGLLAIDEAQTIKNSDTKAHSALCNLSASIKILLTGTPIENSFADLCSLFHLIDPTLLGSPREIALENLPLIRKKIAPFLLKRTKKEVAKDLPPLIEDISWISLYEEERARYDTFIHALRTGTLKKLILDKANPAKVAILEGLLRLRQLVCHPHLFSAEYEQGPATCASAKWDTALSDIRQLAQEGKKVLFFSQFVEILNFFSSTLTKEQITHFQVDGSTKDRQHIIDQFDQAPCGCVLLASLKATGVGLNITAADCVLLYDPWWNGAVEQQAIARAHRIGRTESVYVKRYITLNSIEERVFAVRLKKDKLIEALTSPGGSFDEGPLIESLLFEEVEKQ